MFPVLSAKSGEMEYRLIDCYCKTHYSIFKSYILFNMIKREMRMLNRHFSLFPQIPNWKKVTDELFLRPHDDVSVVQYW